jgi:multidrug transporter EmrE-like cation transporter
MRKKHFYYLLIIPILLIVTGQTLGKIGALNASQRGQLVNIYLIFGYLCLIVRGLFWVIILKEIKLSVAYPIMSITYVFILFISHYIFREPIDINNILGTFLIISGIIMLSLGERRQKRLDNV